MSNSESRGVDRFALSFAQERLWFLHRWMPDSPLYNTASGFLIEGSLNVRALEESLTAIVQRHETLRTVIATTEEGEPRQLILPPRPVHIAIQDLRRVRGDRRSVAVRLAEEEGRRPFDLTAESMMRVRLYRIAAETHLLLIAFHHIVSDGWSASVFGGELTALYGACSRGERAWLPPLPIQYADFAVWQRHRLQQPDMQEELEYWRRQLAGAPLVLAMPTDRPRPPVKRHCGAREKVVLSSSASAMVRRLSRQADATVFMTVLSAFALLLHRHTGQDDILIGTPVANRTRTEIEGLIGFFVNPLVLRMDCAGDPTFARFLRRTRETTLDAYMHQEVPFEEVVRALRPERSPRHTPLFQSAFAFQSAAGTDLTLADLVVTPIELDLATAKFDLSLMLTDTGDALAGALEYDTDLFEAATIRRLAREIETALTEVGRDPSRPLSLVPLLTAAERGAILSAWTAADQAPSAPLGCLHHRFAARVAQSPEAIAVTCGDESLSYAQLDEWATAAAVRLRQLGVGPDVRVGLCVERSIDAAVGMLAILRAGGAYVPMPPAYPGERLLFLMNDSQVRVLLSQRHLASTLPAHAAPRVFLEDIVRGMPAVPPMLRDDADSRNLAYVIYTSGSTGVPKGVAVTHHNVLSLLEATREWGGFGSGDTWTLFHSLAFDFSVWEFWGPLLTGGRVVMIDEATRRSPIDFAAVLRRERVTVLSQTPSMFRALLRADSLAGTRLRLVVFGGEPLFHADLAEWQRRLPGVRLANMYGTTETTVHATRYEPQPGGVDGTVTSPIGRGLDGLRLYVLDAALEPVPIGATGELYVGGAGVARGYLGRPAVTAAAYLPDPYSNERGARMYRAGDLVRYLGEERYAYVGRRDRQVKVRGYRVEPGEIEAVLLAHPHITATHVECRPHGDEHRLVAYLCGDETPVDQVRSYLRDRVPEHMVPSVFVWLPALPLTANGKVDRSALPDPGLQRPPLGAPFAPPRGDLEHAVAGIWQDVLGVERIGINDNFFDLGGSSFTILTVKDHVDRRFGVSLPVIAFFEHPTVSKLSAAILAARSGAESVVAPQPPYPNTASADTDIAVIGMAGRFPGASDVDTLWQNLVAGRESITWFADDDHQDSHVIARSTASRHVPARGIIDDADAFDYPFFGFSARDARLTDPQHRIFLECCWQALADAGYVPAAIDMPVGVFGGTGANSYRELLRTDRAHGAMEGEIGNGKDFLTTTVSYRLRLTGPSVDVQTACSTSLVAVHLACRSVIAGECRMALAGGVSVPTPQRTGYTYVNGGIASPDGHCRAFDEEAAGCVPGSGAGVVVLKRLSDALADEDHVYAVIKGSAINNDGARKVGFAAPSVEGQAEVIRAALRSARVDPRDVGYVEAHGTATALGDPIELEALRQAFGSGPPRSCGLGSIKTNVGHLDAAAGVAGLIKAVLAVHHGRLPPSLHFRRLNPRVSFDGSPFFVVRRLSAWPARERPRIAAVSSFGIGGTNAHVIVAASSQSPDRRIAKTIDIIALSAQTPELLEQSRVSLLALLRRHPAVALADVCCTLQVGRPSLAYRFARACRSRREAIAALSQPAVMSPAPVPEPKRMSPVDGEGTLRRSSMRRFYESDVSYREELGAFIDLAPAALGEAIQQAVQRRRASGLTRTPSGVHKALHRRQIQAHSVDEMLAQLWESGVDVNWAAYRACAAGRRIPLSGHPFVRRHCSAEPSVTTAAPRPRATFRVRLPMWARVSPDPMPVDSRTPAYLLVIAESAGLARVIRNRWRDTAPRTAVVAAVPGDRWERVGAADFTIPPDRAKGWRELIEVLARERCEPEMIVWADVPHNGIRHLSQAVDALGRPCRWHVVGTRLFNVTGSDSPSPRGALAGGAAEWLANRLSCSGVDITEVGEGETDRLADVAASCSISNDAGTSRWRSVRGQHQWRRIWSEREIPVDRVRRFGRRGGVYTITGPPSPGWIDLCSRLSQHGAGALVFLTDEASGSRGWPAFVESAGTHVDLTVPRPQIFEGIAASTRVYSWHCDLTDAVAIEGRLRATERHVGSMTGLLHSPMAGSMGAHLGASVDDRVERSVRTTGALLQALGSRSLDEVICVAAGAGSGDPEEDWFRQLSSAAAEAAFENAAAPLSRLGRVVRVAGNPDPSIGESVWDAVSLASSAQCPSMTILRDAAEPDRRERVPELPVAAASPTQVGPQPDAVTERIAVIWREVFGVDAVDPDANFFEIGGHSLVAIEMAERLSDEFAVPFALRDVFDCTTVSAQAATIAARHRDLHERALLARVLDEVEQSSAIDETAK